MSKASNGGSNGNSSGSTQKRGCLLLVIAVVIFQSVLLVNVLTSKADISLRSLTTTWSVPECSNDATKKSPEKLSSTPSQTKTRTRSNGASFFRPASCRRAHEDVLGDPENLDPNGGQAYIRQTLTEPPFWISFHNKDYDKVRWSTWETGLYYERMVTTHAKEILEKSPKDSLVVDVGMNIGWFSLYAAALGHSVVAFEPNPTNRLRLCQSLRMNGWTDDDDRVQVYPMAVGHEQGKVLELKWTSNPGAASFFHSGNEITGALNVTIVTLDFVAKTLNWYQEHQGTNIALLKIDVEGYDHEVLLGSNELLRSNMVQNIFIELSPTIRTKEDSVTMLQTLYDHGYTLHVLGGWNGAPIQNFDPNVPSSTKQQNNVEAHCSAIFDACEESGSGNCNLWWKLDTSKHEVKRA